MMILVRAWSGSLPVVQRNNIRCNNRVDEVSVQEHSRLNENGAGTEQG